MTVRWIVCICGGGDGELKGTNFFGLFELAKLKILLLLLLLLLLYIKKKAVGLVNFFLYFRI